MQNWADKYVTIIQKEACGIRAWNLFIAKILSEEINSMAPNKIYKFAGFDQCKLPLKANKSITEIVMA